jgi:hypothetical protein
MFICRNLFVIPSLILLLSFIGPGLFCLIESDINEQAYLWFWCLVEIIFLFVLFIRVFIRLFWKERSIPDTEAGGLPKSNSTADLVRNASIADKILMLIFSGTFLWECIILSMVSNGSGYLWIWFRMIYGFSFISFAVLFLFTCLAVYRILRS